MRTVAGPGSDTRVVLLVAFFIELSRASVTCQSHGHVEWPLIDMNSIFSLTDSYMAELKAAGEKENGEEKIRIRVYMHTGNPFLNGCGFFASVGGEDGGEHFPRYRHHWCGDGSRGYRMRMTLPAGVYEVRLRPDGHGSTAVRRAEVHADGWHDTYVKALCVGFVAQPSGGERAFCVDNVVLRACQELRPAIVRWSHVEPGSRDVLMTRTTRGTHKILFRDLRALADDFARFRACRNDVALRAVCRRIDLVRGADGDGKDTCTVETKKSTVNGSSWLFSGSGDGEPLATDSEYDYSERNPYRCFTHGVG